jgi:glycosyltransferase involved in cell wall biosynthesis
MIDYKSQGDVAGQIRFAPRMPTVSILIPCLQERHFIRECLRSALAFEVPPGFELVEILALDGGSTDGTQAIIEEMSRQDARIRLIHNPGRIQATALNIGIRETKSDFLVRLDAHSAYPSDYMALALDTAVRRGCDNAGGMFATQSRGDSYQARFVQALITHPFGVGDAGFRIDAPEGKADTVPYGCFRRDLFDRIGYFDERLVRAQDYEMNRRIIEAGGEIWRNPRIQVKYHPPGDFATFIRKQIVFEAPYNAYMWYLAPYAFAPRHAITGVFAVGVIGGIVLSFVSSWIAAAFAAVMALYTGLAVVSAIQQSRRYREPKHILTLPFGFFLYHFLHGTGVVYGLMRLLTGSAPVQRVKEPWPGAGRFRAWPPDAARS